ncbi:hypothetical protein J8E27_09180 [Brucella sp. 458]|uniref:hypothetical protein n=1 Tax=Brucella sp. 458 TaxID=2821140 RepID=UPI001ADF5DF7|nr:hypothetical protein [Brucella sp. 458]QTN98412.1 hypothetical protein J8E27_09180 [Brucella sp. 458]
MTADNAIATKTSQTRTQVGRWPARGPQRDPLYDALGRLADFIARFDFVIVGELGYQIWFGLSEQFRAFR